MLPRLTEILFIAILRHEILMADPAAVGWLAAIADPSLSRCLSLIHEDPRRHWPRENLASSSGMSRSALADRFQAVLGTSPIRYVRDWRLYLASVALASTAKTISTVAREAGYDTNAAFTRAFARAFGSLPAAWRAAAAK
jgi:AraC-like DNA-binding protein